MRPQFVRRLEGRLGPFEQLDFLSTSSATCDGPPHLLLTDQLEGDRPVFVDRVVTESPSTRR
jgi:hypothetical protein